MKVLALVCLVFGSVAAGGSGPYLPSGWKPQGPAFLLPSEVEKPDSPLKETLQVEAEGSDSLREYGPPEFSEVSQDLTQQALPDEVTEQAFALIDLKETRELEESNAEIKTDVETATEQITEDVTTPLQESTESIEQTEEQVTENFIKTGKSLEISEESNSKLVSAVEQQGQEIVEEVAKEAESQANLNDVNNIADALANLESEIQAQQFDRSQGVVQQKSVTIVETTGSDVQGPEGFLEYGPPGFREYGPPKEDLKKAAAESTNDAVETNEARRRRFSPKVRLSRRGH